MSCAWTIFCEVHEIMPAGRPKDTPNKKKPGDVGYRKPGRKPGQLSIKTRMPQMLDAEILDAKVDILRLLTDGEVKVDGKLLPILTLTDAARALGLKPANVHNWANNDKDFQELVKNAKKVVADDIIHEFITNKPHYYIPKMMIVKGTYPELRDNFRVEHSSEKLEAMLDELKRLGHTKPEEE